jgi:hypothetical protein
VTGVFRPVGPGGNWRLSVVVERRSDHAIAMGFAEAAELIVEHWVERGPNDLLFEPLVFNHRHALELILKAAIRESAARLRVDGYTDATVNETEVDNWLAKIGSHNLHKLVTRLDGLLTRLRLEKLPGDTHDVLMALHTLDPGGDAFRYATVKGPDGRWVDAPRPLLSTPEDLQAHVDIVAMHEHFRSAFSLLSGGVMTVLENVAEQQAEVAREIDL